MNKEGGGANGFGLWLRANLAAVVFLVSVVSGTAGALITATFEYANYNFRLNALEVSIKPDRLGVLEARMAVDEDRNREERVASAAANAVLAQRIGILESQVKFLGDLAHDNLVEHRIAGLRK